MDNKDQIRRLSNANRELRYELDQHRSWNDQGQHNQKIKELKVQILDNSIQIERLRKPWNQPTHPGLVLSAKARLQSAYKLKTVPDHYVSDMLEIGKILDEEGGLKAVASIGPYTFCTGPLPQTKSYAPRSQVVALKDGEEIALFTIFEPVDLSSLLRQDVTFVGKVMTPHVAANPKYQRRGLARVVYGSVLSEGCSFYTESHTAEALALWRSVAALTKARLYIVNRRSRNPLREKQPPFVLLEDQALTSGDGLLLSTKTL